MVHIYQKRRAAVGPGAGSELSKLEVSCTVVLEL